MVKDINQILQEIEALPFQDKIYTARVLATKYLQNEVLKVRRTDEKEIAEERFAMGRCCPHCGCVKPLRYGHTKSGKQRYRCKDCGKTFSVTTESLFFHTRKPLSVWEKYIECMLYKYPLRMCAELCGIDLTTAFSWRHKILDSLQNMADSVYLMGITEADETFFRISYKGNHRNSKFQKEIHFILPRPAHKRGKDHEYEMIDTENNTKEIRKKNNKRGLSKDLVCVPCAVARNGYSISKISNLGKVSKEALDKVYQNRIQPNTVLCTDKEKSYRKFAIEMELDLYQIEGHKTVKGLYNIQKINSYHSMLKDFMRRFKGVSTKYLNNYLIWHNILNYSKGSMKDKFQDILSTMKTAKFNEQTHTMRERTPIPILV